MQFSSLTVSSIATNDTLKCSKLTTVCSLGILHVDYESLIPYLSESIKANFNDIKNLKSTTDKLNFAVDALYDQFVKQSKSSVTEVSSTAYITPKSPKPAISKLWRVVIAAVCVLGLVTGCIVLALTLQPNQESDGEWSNQPNHPVTPTDDSMLNLDLETLTEFYHALNGDNWKRKDGWLSNTDYCEWYGVNCTTYTSRVTYLKLPANNLTGTIPANISRLTFLWVMDLSNNTIQGTIPDSITSIKQLKKLILKHNMISGSLPDTIGDMPALRMLDLRHNSIHGRLPYSVAESEALSDLDLSHNQMYGHLPDFVGTVTFINLANNMFSGDLPLFSLSVTYLYLGNNHLTGLTWKLGALSQIQDLELQNNGFSGEFRLSVSQYRQLVGLDISGNNFTSFVADGVQYWRNYMYCNIANNNFSCPLDPLVAQKCINTCSAT